MKQEWDPYDHLMEITHFCNSADDHIKTLIENQKVFIETINDMKQEIQILKDNLDLVERILENGS